MAGDLLERAELVKLARMLSADEGDVAFLAPLGRDGLRLLQARVAAMLFDEHRGALQRLAEAAKLLPASLIAKMSERVFGPALSARVCGAMDPDRAVEIAQKLRTKFLADVTVQLDPRSAAAVLAKIPLKITLEVARVLLERGEYVTLGRFVDSLTDDAIRAVMQEVSDEALIRIGVFVERKERLSQLIDVAGGARLEGIVKAVATGPTEVQAAGLAMMGLLPPRQQGRLGDIAITLGPATLTSLVAAAQAVHAVDVVSAAMVNVSAEGRRAFADLLEATEPGLLHAWAEATTRAGLWPAALKILADSGAQIQQKAAAALRRLPPADRATIAAQVKAAKLGPALRALQDALA